MSDFKYSAKKINKLIDEYNLRPATMLGVVEDLKKLKPLIEDFYDKHIFYLDYWEGDCPYFGWDWSKDDGRMKDMATVTSGITECFHQIYALILAGLGERIDNED